MYIVIGLIILAIVFIFVKYASFNYAFKNTMEYQQNTDYNNMVNKINRKK